MRPLAHRRASDHEAAARARGLPARCSKSCAAIDRSLALLFIAPIVITGLLAFILREQDAPEPRIAVVAIDQQVGPLVATAISEAATQDGGIVIVDLGATADEATARQAIRDDRIDVAVIIPDGLAAGLSAGRGDLASPNGRASTLRRRAATSAICSPPSATLWAPWPRRARRSRTWRSSTRSSMARLMPMSSTSSHRPSSAFFSYFFVFVLTGVSFLRERVGGTLERLLATPVTRGEIVTGYSLGFGVLAVVQVALLLTLAPARRSPSRPSGRCLRSRSDSACRPPAALRSSTASRSCAALGAVNLGVFLSTYARTELQIIQFIPIVIVPQALLSGVLFPVAALPPILQPISHLMPMTYAIEGLREVMIKGATLASSAVQVDLLFLAGVAVLFVVLAARTIRREIA